MLRLVMALSLVASPVPALADPVPGVSADDDGGCKVSTKKKSSMLGSALGSLTSRAMGRPSVLGGLISVNEFTSTLTDAIACKLDKVEQKQAADATNTAVRRGVGAIDSGAADNLKAAIDQYQPAEIWLRSPGGNATVGNAAGKVVRAACVPTRIPAGWACFSACNFVFMGGPARFVDDGGLFIVHMFTHLADKAAVKAELKGDDALEVVGDIEQGSALLASDDNDFLIRMGVSRKLLTEVMYQQKAVAGAADKSTRRCLTQAELVKYNVKNAG